MAIIILDDATRDRVETDYEGGTGNYGVVVIVNNEKVGGLSKLEIKTRFDINVYDIVGDPVAVTATLGYTKTEHVDRLRELGFEVQLIDPFADA